MVSEDKYEIKRKRKDKKMKHLRLKKRQFEATKDTIITVNILNKCHCLVILQYAITRT